METKTIKQRAEDFFRSISGDLSDSDSIIIVVSDGKGSQTGISGKTMELATSLYASISSNEDFREIVEAVITTYNYDKESAGKPEGTDQALPDLSALEA